MNAVLNQQIIETYRRRARRYDFTANLYYLVGYREWAYRRKAVEALQLQPGDTVVEIACGTGLNFSLYQKAIGPQGKIIGLDLTDAMLAQAQQRIEEKGWSNVELVHLDARDYNFPAGVNAIISTFALSLIPESDRVLERAVEVLAPGGRLALLELQIPAKWPGWMAKAGVWLMKPFAVTDEWLNRRPWETIQQTMRLKLTEVSVTEKYLGLTYIIAGRKA
jgi:demethylmenaquinone methyltransferase/2-methoxy-6-polyprenyl-1,4-benzoquinol methylase